MDSEPKPNSLPVFWQHLGLGGNGDKTYLSKRINKDTVSGDPLYDVGFISTDVDIGYYKIGGSN